MNEDFGGFRITVSWVCLILITVINIGFCIWANNESYNSKLQLLQIQKEIQTNNSNDKTSLNDNPLSQLNPFLNAGKVANPALKIFIIGIFSGFFSSISLLIPKFLLKGIKGSFTMQDEFDKFNKFYKIFIASNIIIIVFEFYGLFTWFDYSSTIVNALKG